MSSHALSALGLILSGAAVALAIVSLLLNWPKPR